MRKSVVGDPLLRGVSGGEKKRVTIGEMICSRGRVLLADGYSKGLDSSAALDVAKAMRVMARVLHIPVIATQYQASQEIYEQFDKVLVMQDSRSVYFGPTAGALPYFESIGMFCPKRRSIPDFLGSLSVQLPSDADSSLSVSALVPQSPGGPNAEFGEHYVVVDNSGCPLHAHPTLQSLVVRVLNPGTVLRASPDKDDEGMSPNPGGHQWMCVEGGWIICRDPSGVYAEPVAQSDVVLMGLPQPYLVYNGVYSMTRGDTADDHPIFVRRNPPPMSSEVQFAPDMQLSFDTDRRGWQLAPIFAPAELIAFTRTPDRVPGRSNTNWSVRDPETNRFYFDASVNVSFISGEPRSAESLAATFRQSPQYAAVLRELPNAIGPAVHNEAKESIDAQARQYSQSTWQQTRLLLEREFALMRKDTFALRSRFMRFIMVGLIIGALFWNMSTTIEGGLYSRPGLIFFALTFVTMSSFGFLSQFIQRRDVFYKHRDANFHSSLPYLLSIIILDLPLIFIETLLFSAIIFFMTGLNRMDNGMRFFFFWLLLSVMSTTMATYVRMISCLGKDLPRAQVFGAGTAVLYILFSGYLIPRAQIPPYFIWIHYISPVKYTFEALMLNEFDGLVFTSKVNPAVALPGA